MIHSASLASSAPSVSPRADQVMNILEAYLAELEDGAAPHPDVLLARHPDLAEPLRAYLASLELLHHAALSLHGTAALAGLPEPAGQLGELGDFRLVREVGRGGMGVVYEAEQRSLKRRVALKVLPFAAALDPRHLRRFQHEAQAAAHLHHTHIVPVHAVGCERGVHYYAMQFIDGRTLATVIVDLRRRAGLAPDVSVAPGELPAPTRPFSPAVPLADTAVQALTLASAESTRTSAFFRTVAQWGIQAAEALEHAHQLGVVHRDIKPANLLIDEVGTLWITDFGLAQFQNEASLTRSGDLLGTLRYMSPEQALSGLVDQRTDIYSLGALYEVVTLQPACPGQDRQEVFRRIEREEPRRPRQLNPAMPADLETILLKAMAKEPGGRYATAQELADDLRRFLEDKPIRARRPSFLERGRKLARRHRIVTAALVGATTLVVVTLVLSLVISNVLVSRQRDRTRANLEQALDMLDDVYGSVVGEGLPRTDRESHQAQKQLRKLLNFYERFLETNPADRKVRYRAALTCQNVANIRLGEGIAAHRRAFAILKTLKEEFPREPDYREALAGAANDLGLALARSNQAPEEALAASRLALDLLDQLAGDFPDRPRYRVKAALVLFSSLSAALGQAGRPDAVEQACRDAVHRSEQLVQEFPGKAEYHRLLAISLTDVGFALATHQRPGEAEEFYRRSLAEWDQIPVGKLEGGNSEMERGSASLGLGLLLHQRGELAEAHRCLEHAVALDRGAYEAEPLNPQAGARLRNSQAAFAHLIRDEAATRLGFRHPLPPPTK
jgi:serine/threonine protein kinase